MTLNLSKCACTFDLKNNNYFSVCGEPVDYNEDDDKLDIEDDFREDLTIKNLPWMVSMGYFETPDKWIHQCGGSLITHR